MLHRRHLMLVPIFAAHGVALALASAFVIVAPPSAQSDAPALNVFDVPAAGASQPTPPITTDRQAATMQAPIIPTIDLPPPLMVMALAPPPAGSLAQPAAAAASGGSCDLTGPVQSALREDAAARAALATVPRPERSVANAIMLWGGRWSPDTRLAAVRRVVAATVMAAPARCRAEAQAGPRLIVMGDAGATVLVLGSGQWHWADLAEPAPPTITYVAAEFVAAELINDGARLNRN